MKVLDALPTKWHKLYLVVWGLWALFATTMAVIGGHGLRGWWWVLGASFFLFEGIGAVSRVDGAPMLTEVFGRYVPGWLLFPVLSVAVWRLAHWVPGWIVFPFAAWQVWHFITTYHTFQKMGNTPTPTP